MIKLSCKETGLECDYFVEGKTEDEVMERISEHAVKVHKMKEEDIYQEHISAAFLCHTIGKMASIHNKQD